jgi:hypothetical protein
MQQQHYRASIFCTTDDGAFVSILQSRANYLLTAAAAAAAAGYFMV